MARENNIRVLIVDDSVTVRNLLRLIISEDHHFEIVGIVSNGVEACSFVEKERPDVISMDIHMPVMNGFEATRKIMASYPVPIVIVSSAYNPGETELSFNALEAGALAILPRPSGPGHPDFIKQVKQYRSTLKSLSEVRVVRRHQGSTATADRLPPEKKNSIVQDAKEHPPTHSKMVAIGASAGGPAALQTLLKSIPPGFPAPLLIVQHIDKGFAEGFAHWLGSTSAVPVHISRDGETLIPGHAYLPPGDHHLGLKKEGVASVSAAPAEQGLRPSVGFLFRSVAGIYSRTAVAILLSGMGRDGAPEMKILKDAGVFTIVQDEESSLVNGMPGEAVRLHAACRVLPPQRMVPAIVNHFNSLP